MCVFSGTFSQTVDGGDPVRWVRFGIGPYSWNISRHLTYAMRNSPWFVIFTLPDFVAGTSRIGICVCVLCLYLV